MYEDKLFGISLTRLKTLPRDCPSLGSVFISAFLYINLFRSMDMYVLIDFLEGATA